MIFQSTMQGIIIIIVSIICTSTTIVIGIKTKSEAIYGYQDLRLDKEENEANSLLQEDNLCSSNIASG